MRTLRRFILLGIIAFTLQANAQVINLNPDVDGEPWWSGEYDPAVLKVY